MSMFRDIEKRFKLMLESVDKISDKEAKRDFEDLDDTDIDNDNSEDSVIAVEENITVSESNDLGVEEPYYVEISVRDARKAADTISDVPMLKRALRDDIIVTYGSNVYATKKKRTFRDLMYVLEDRKIEISSSSELDEMSTTSSVAAYDSPNAFGKQSDKDIEVLGYKKVPKKDMNMKENKKSTYKSMMDVMYSINEVSYRAYKNDESATPVQKVNKGIQEVNKMIAEMENIVNLNLRLKTESDVNSSQFWKSTSKRFTKINERLIRISNKLKELSK